ncbi:hypothetical protein BaRGS_00011237, partial [Batillaria attramentaria]
FANVAVYKSARQSSWKQPGDDSPIQYTGKAYNAVDGIKNGHYPSGSCTHTKDRDDSPW